MLFVACFEPVDYNFLFGQLTFASYPFLLSYQLGTSITASNFLEFFQSGTNTVLILALTLLTAGLVVGNAPPIFAPTP